MSPTENNHETTVFPAATSDVRDSESEITFLRGLVNRLRHKASGCRWARQRILLREQGVDYWTEIAPIDQELIEQARQRNCYLWMNTASFDTAESFDKLVGLADWFDVVADAVELVLMAGIAGDEPVLDDDAVLPLIAEAQFGLWMAVQAVNDTKDDDQTALFCWLRETCTRARLFLPNFLCADETLDVPDANELRGRIKKLTIIAEQRQRCVTSQRKLFGKLRYLTWIDEQPRPESTIEWPTIALTVDQLINSGASPSNKVLRSLLSPFLAVIPTTDDWPIGFRLTVRELRNAQSLPRNEVATDQQIERSEAIQSISELIAGRTVVLIGGDCQLERKAELEKAFNLTELIWIETTRSTSVCTFEPYVSRPEVALVLLAIRWASHRFGDVQDYCDKYGKPLVRLPNGLGVNQIAAQIMDQCSKRLNVAHGIGLDAC